MPPSKSETKLDEIGKNTKKIADELSIIANTKTGRKIDGIGLMQAGAATAIGGMGALTAGPPGVPAAAALGVMGVGLAGRGLMVHGKDETVERDFSLNEALDAYKENLKTKASKANKFTEEDRVDPERYAKALRSLIDAKKAATFENEAIVTGLAVTWEGFAGQLNALRKFGGKMVDPSAEQGIIRKIEAVRDALGEILNMADDPKAAQLLSRMQDFLGRNAPAAPTAPSVDDFRELQAPGQRLGLASPLWANSVASRESPVFDDADPVAKYVQQLGAKAEVAAQGFEELNAQGKQFEALAGTMADRVADTNTQLAGQADWLTTVGGLLPGVGQQITDLFATGVAGAEDLDRAVAAMDERLIDAFEGAILRGESLSGVFKGLARDLAELALNEVKTNGFGGLLGKIGSFFGGSAAATAATPSFAQSMAGTVMWTAKGNAFDRGRLASFARGGALTNSIVNRPTLFPMADGAGLMRDSCRESLGGVLKRLGLGFAELVLNVFKTNGLGGGGCTAFA